MATSKTYYVCPRCNDDDIDTMVAPAVCMTCANTGAARDWARPYLNSAERREADEFLARHTTGKALARAVYRLDADAYDFWLGVFDVSNESSLIHEFFAYARAQRAQQRKGA
jgi:hypothetical protein